MISMISVCRNISLKHSIKLFHIDPNRVNKHEQSLFKNKCCIDMFVCVCLFVCVLACVFAFQRTCAYQNIFCWYSLLYA